MLYTIVKQNSYQDSVNLMLLTNKISTMEGVNKVQIMMGTPANKDIFKTAGLFTEELEGAASNDMCIVVDTDSEEKIQEVLDEVDNYLSNQAISNSKEAFETVRSWDKATQALPGANLAIISTPGQYAAEEAEKALDRDMHVLIFSDNVTIEDERRIKEKAHEKGLLVMGPDCGTAVVSGVPLAFANVVKTGKIGVIGASGTGIQEVITEIDRLGSGVSHAIGTGGRDLNDKIGAITMLDGIKALAQHSQTEVITLISKPPAKEVRDEVVQLLQSISKPVVAIFLGEEPHNHEGNVYYANTLEETAAIAVDLAKGNAIKPNYNTLQAEVPAVNLKYEQKTIKGLYSGGTLGYEAATLISRGLNLGTTDHHEDGYLLNANGFEVIDLGDDIYTQGKPHPMIDPDTRIQFFQKAAQDESTAIILFDVVLGYGSHEDMAGALIPGIQKIQNAAKENGRNIYFVGTVCGTDQDPQDIDDQKAKLEQAGVILRDSNNQAVLTALAMLDIQIEEVQKEVVSAKDAANANIAVSEAIQKLLTEKPNVVNVGLKKFTDAITANGGRVVQFDWRPVAGGNPRMRKILSVLR
ncbi:acyl-CoA synthetase FdrA [Bacillus sp. DTU_2020_1000418_1_SI_GHA_SEK_038]|uniref:acyl-CoA synthetase FdrA n=1 Tax=Bacillus sp. DTU_2020_1000418_1_SI_GHA_SEK_038 TaxID=3077585 RepID=UPI0028E5AD41|nr:acyl-CoA synthetase FdrA [Bacillus sp. DTU_2020_1000418_1_SI_GHA_SEK_038]WNS76520.1 acyl-CoA synthetase FdrA [Bacillus sp. DTU_2020_1000418_1_SI_GHA_SEK_038]